MDEQRNDDRSRFQKVKIRCCWYR